MAKGKNKDRRGMKHQDNNSIPNRVQVPYKGFKRIWVYGSAL
jgi:hypothetical protein